ncbi:unnamed protein product [Clavelina lepadiformis]|uniref:MGA conserved domain-containing protein n=1 Tax=Clavelina lepadiformis TaxID=159417 RepID=A0ABP0GY54_CLALP
MLGMTALKDCCDFREVVYCHNFIGKKLEQVRTVLYNPSNSQPGSFSDISCDMYIEADTSKKLQDCISLRTEKVKHVFNAVINSATDLEEIGIDVGSYAHPCIFVKTCSAKDVLAPFLHLINLNAFWLHKLFHLIKRNDDNLRKKEEFIVPHEKLNIGFKYSNLCCDLDFIWPHGKLKSHFLLTQTKQTIKSKSYNLKNREPFHATKNVCHNVRATNATMFTNKNSTVMNRLSNGYKLDFLPISKKLISNAVTKLEQAWKSQSEISAVNQNFFSKTLEANLSTMIIDENKVEKALSALKDGHEFIAYSSKRVKRKSGESPLLLIRRRYLHSPKLSSNKKENCRHVNEALDLSKYEIPNRYPEYSCFDDQCNTSICVLHPTFSLAVTQCQCNCRNNRRVYGATGDPASLLSDKNTPMKKVVPAPETSVELCETVGEVQNINVTHTSKDTFSLDMLSSVTNLASKVSSMLEYPDSLQEMLTAILDGSLHTLEKLLLPNLETDFVPYTMEEFQINDELQARVGAKPIKTKPTPTADLSQENILFSNVHGGKPNSNVTLLERLGNFLTVKPNTNKNNIKSNGFSHLNLNAISDGQLMSSSTKQLTKKYSEKMQFSQASNFGKLYQPLVKSCNVILKPIDDSLQNHGVNLKSQSTVHLSVFSDKPHGHGHQKTENSTFNTEVKTKVCKTAKKQVLGVKRNSGLFCLSSDIYRLKRKHKGVVRYWPHEVEEVYAVLKSFHKPVYQYSSKFSTLSPKIKMLVDVVPGQLKSLLMDKLNMSHIRSSYMDATQAKYAFHSYPMLPPGITQPASGPAGLSTSVEDVYESAPHNIFTQNPMETSRKQTRDVLHEGTATSSTIFETSFENLKEQLFLKRNADYATEVTNSGSEGLACTGVNMVYVSLDETEECDTPSLGSSMSVIEQTSNQWNKLSTAKRSKKNWKLTHVSTSSFKEKVLKEFDSSNGQLTEENFQLVNPFINNVFSKQKKKRTKCQTFCSPAKNGHGKFMLKHATPGSYIKKILQTGL